MTPQSISYTANGTCTAFPYGFPVFEDMELEVLIDGVLQTSGYTLVGDGANTGGAVVFAAAPASGTAIVLRRAGKVQVSGSDAPGFLADKVVAGANVTVTQVAGALEIAASADPADFLRKDQNLADLTDAAAARSHLGLGSAAVLDAGTSAGDVVQLDSSARLPAVDASLLTNLPHPTATTLGGVEAFAPQSHKFLTGIGTDGVPTAAQPAASDVSGLASVATSGAYSDLSGRPTLGTAAALDVDTDGTLAANSDTRLPSQKAVKTYVDGLPARANSFTAKQTFTKSVETAKGAAVASAATTDIWSNADGNLVHVTGTTTITSFGTAPQAGAQRVVVFDGALTLTNGANLILPGGANITTAAGDMAVVYAESATQFRMDYARASGNAVAGGSGEVLVNVQTVSGVQWVDFLGFVADYDYIIRATNLSVSADDYLAFYFQTGGSTFNSPSGQFAANFTPVGSGGVSMGDGISGWLDATGRAYLSVEMPNPNSADTAKHGLVNVSGWYYGGYQGGFGSAIYNSSAAVTGARLRTKSGNTINGTFQLWKRKRS
jgi:hypothetical protein